MPYPTQIISVITVVYNGAATLEETIQSVLGQSWPNVEYIIIDGNSIDGTQAIIEKYKPQLAYYISEKDKGIYDAMNKGLAKAKGDYCIFMGADDVLLPNVLEQIVPLLKDKDTVYYGDIIVKGTERRYDGAFSKFKLCFKNICHQCIFYPRSAYSKLNYDLQYRLWADWVYNIILWGERKVPYVYIGRDISIFNDGGVGSLSRDKVFDANRKLLIQQHFGSFMNSVVSLKNLLSKVKAKLIR
ncbi:glycosyltransferase family 2 protein [Chitinophaga sancti]|uniref:Glycosyltransferase family 2 protein n=1 Tax=Chitinophaga sancti TaxID=1004 RepID=A0A1K1RK77_9BACT|nr:glycosyltransferase family 2 protein [Chitinophaga sancti]WQD60753.1 glycosyltransferase family 2 protein [Chitinophaga sancti]WQG87119.1 glycosyltransferase family 2 protein [Chitinophaga sancti]SFW72329.1 Glycosyltransferase involved in cell wall bisynthesis [Chitinophaga sancti]